MDSNFSNCPNLIRLNHYSFINNEHDVIFITVFITPSEIEELYKFIFENINLKQFIDEETKTPLSQFAYGIGRRVGIIMKLNEDNGGNEDDLKNKLIKLVIKPHP